MTVILFNHKLWSSNYFQISDPCVHVVRNTRHFPSCFISQYMSLFMVRKSFQMVVALNAITN